MILADLMPKFVHIVAAPFLMGTPESELSNLARCYGGTRESYREESPQHSLLLPTFSIARTPVTNALYGQYTRASGARPPLTWHDQVPPAELSDHPVVDVSWEDAQAFCAWLTFEARQAGYIPVNAGKPPALPDALFRLPSEAEWEHAARGRDGRSFPWGSEFSAECANTREAAQYSTTPVDRYAGGASPYGVLDMAGNVWEWTASLDGLYPYRPDDGREEPQAAGRRIARGGCYANPQGFARCACRFRFAPDVRSPFLGFRLAI